MIKTTIPHHRLLLILLFLFPFLLHSEVKLHWNLGGVYTEDFFSVIYQTQLSPIFSTGAEIIRPIKLIKRLKIRHQINYQLTGGNYYWKNQLIYHTEKTYTLDQSFSYRILFDLKLLPMLSLIFGSSFYTTIRSDRYATGIYYDSTDLRIIPFAPMIASGFDFPFSNYIQLSILHEIGGMVGIHLHLIGDDWEQVKTFGNYFLQNTIQANLSFLVHQKFWLVCGWQNILQANLDLYDLTGKLFWKNSWTLGVKIEL